MVKVVKTPAGRTVFLSEVAEKPIYTRNGGNGLIPAPGFKALVDKDSISRIYAVVSERYTPIQHHEVMEALSDYLSGYDIRKEEFWTDGARMVYKAIIGEFGVENEKFYWGIAVTNSYSGDMGVYVGGYIVRLACMNQLILGNEILLKYRKHVGLRNREVKDMIKDVLSSVEEMKLHLQLLMNAKVPKELVMAQIKAWNLEERLKAEIRRWGRVNFVSVWEWLNALTYFYTHVFKGSEFYRFMWLRRVGKTSKEFLRVAEKVKEAPPMPIAR